MRFLLRTGLENYYLMERAYQQIATSVVRTYHCLTFCNIAMFSQKIRGERNALSSNFLAEKFHD